MGPILFAPGGTPPGVIYILHFILYLYLFYHQSSIITHHSSIISHQSSVINHQLSIINHPWSMINHQSSITSHLFFYEKKQTSVTKWVGNRFHEVLIGGTEAAKWDLSLLQWFRGVIKGCWWGLWRKNMAILVVMRVIWEPWKIKIARRGPRAKTLIIWTP